MKQVKINGFIYYWDGSKLWLEQEKINEVPQKHMTANEKMQLETWVKYDGKPMWSFD